VTNLLPAKESMSVKWERRRRIGMVALILFVCTVVLLLLFAIPSAIVTWTGAVGFDMQLKATKTLVDLQRKKSGSEVLSDLSSRIDILKETLLQLSPTTVLETIIGCIPPGVHVSQFSYSYGEKEVSISIVGRSSTRVALITFGNTLRDSSLFSCVDVPVSSLAKSENIDFSLVLTLKNPETLSQATSLSSVSTVIQDFQFDQEKAIMDNVESFEVQQ